MVVVGNGRGKVGWGYGKANEVPPSVEKAVKDGSRSMIEVPLEGSTIPHPVIGHFGASHVVLVPASPGTGVIAGAAVRAVCEAAGIHDILTKSFGSTNPINLVKATLNALNNLRTQQDVRAVARSLAVMNLHDVHRGDSETQEAHARSAAAPARATARPPAAATRAKVSLAGWSAPAVFEGARMPLIRRIPKRGFHNQWGPRGGSGQRERLE